MKVKIIFNKSNTSNKLKQIKFIKEFLEITFEDAKYMVDSGSIVIPYNSVINGKTKSINDINDEIKLELGLKFEYIKEDELLDNIEFDSDIKQEFKDKSCVIISKKKYDTLLQYKKLYKDLLGTLRSVTNQFINIHKNN